jgi:hypothetical protein
MALPMNRITKIITVSPVWIGTSVAVSVLVLITSLSGILLENTYTQETYRWALLSTGQDSVTFTVVILLLVSTYFVANHSIRGYLVWLGACLYLLYSFMISSFALPFSFLFLMYVLIIGLSFYTLVGGMMAADWDTIAPVLRGNPIAKAAGALLLVIGVVFSLFWLSEIIPDLLAAMNSMVPSDMQIPVSLVHLLFLCILLPGMIITAVLLWKENLLGYFMAVPLLVFAAAVALGIIGLVISSAIHSLPYSMPVLGISGIILVFSTCFSCLFLKEVKQDGKTILP